MEVINKSFTNLLKLKPSGIVAPPPPAFSSSVCLADCPICGGSGWVSAGDLPVNDPNFGKLVYCPNADFFRAYGPEFIGLEPGDRDSTWESIVERENVLEGIAAVQSALSRGYGWVFLWGGYGLAKSMILRIAAAYSIRDRKMAAYVRMSEIIDFIRTGFDKSGEEVNRRMEWYQKLPVLCIDEFEKARETPFATDVRFGLMDKRYEAAASKKSLTLIASNQPPEFYDGYLADRILDGRFAVVKLVGKSARPLMSY